MTAGAFSSVWVLFSWAQEGNLGMAPLRAEPPIGGPFWTVVIPAMLLTGSFLGTYLLYKRFAREKEQ